ALAHHPPLHVGEGDDDGVDLAPADGVAKVVEGHHRRRILVRERGVGRRPPLAMPLYAGAASGGPASAGRSTVRIGPLNQCLADTIPQIPTARMTAPTSTGAYWM